MRHTFSFVLPACLVLSFDSSVLAQQPLAIADAIAIGMEKNSDVKIAMLKAESVGDARISEMEANRLPSLKFSAGYTRLSNIGIPVFPISIPGLNIPPIQFPTYFLDNYSTKLSLSQPIFTGFRLSSQMKAAEHTSEAAKQDVQAAKTDLAFSIQQEYWQLYKYQQTLSAEIADSEEANSHVADVQHDYASGTALQADVLKSQVQVSNIELQIMQTRNAIKVTMAQLMNTLGLPLTTLVELTTTPDSQPPPDQQLSALITKAQAKRAELKAADERIEAQRNAISVAQAGYYPQVSVTGDVYYANPNSRYFPAVQTWNSTWDASVNLSWDLWTWNTPGHQSEEAQYELEQLQETRAQAEQNIALDVTQNYLAQQTSFAQIRVAKLSVEQAAENLRVVKLQWAQGEATNTDVLDAEMLSMQSQVNYYSAIADANVATAKLLASVGG